MKRVHILNGDALKSQVSDLLSDDIIIMRECLIDGNVQGDSLTAFYANRAKFIASYQNFSATQYYQVSVPQINKMNDIDLDSEIICWFEDDLFCQVNFWFVMNLLSKKAEYRKIYLVRPSKGNEYSFATMASYELKIALAKKKALTPQQFKLFSFLWPRYQRNDYQGMIEVAKQLQATLPFLLPAVMAHQRRAPDKSGWGYPERQLIAIMKELNTQDFTTVFQCFSAREAIYSFGDLQVQQMFERVRHYVQT